MEEPAITVVRDGVIQSASPRALALLGQVNGRACCTVLPQCGQCSSGCPVSRSAPVHTRVLSRGLRRLRVSCHRTGQSVVMTIDKLQSPLRVGLSGREAEVLSLIAGGLTSREIAGRLRLSMSTIRTHIEHARTKLDARTQAQAVAQALSAGLIRIRPAA